MIIIFYSRIVFLGDTHLLMKTILQGILLSCEYLNSKPNTQAQVTVLHHNSNWKNRTFTGATAYDDQSYYGNSNLFYMQIDDSLFIIDYHPGRIWAFSVFVPLRYTLRVYPSQDTVLRPSLSGTHTPHVHQYIRYLLMWQ